MFDICFKLLMQFQLIIVFILILKSKIYARFKLKVFENLIFFVISLELYSTAAFLVEARTADTGEIKYKACLNYEFIIK